MPLIAPQEFRQLQSQFKQLLEKQTQNFKRKRVMIEKDPPVNENSNLIPIKLPEFHCNRSEYPAWRAAILDIFRMYWNLFGYDNPRAFLMIYKFLKGDVRIKGGHLYETGGVNETRDPEDFIKFLDRLFLDSIRISKANLELHNMKMKENQCFADFYAAWNNKLTEARGQMKIKFR